MAWIIAAALLGLAVGYLLGTRVEEKAWHGFMDELLTRCPTADEMGRVLHALAELERLRRDRAELPQAENVVGLDEARERTPKRLREKENRTFWS